MKRIITALMTLTLVLSLVSGLTLTASAAVPEKSKDGAHTLVNFALNQDIEATSAYIAPEGFFAPELLVDGQWGTYADGNVKLGWNSDTVGTIHSENDEIDITVSLDTYYQLECIVVKPMQWAAGAGFPRDYELQVSTNGQKWTTVASDKDVDASAPSDTEVVPREYPVDPAVCRFFRIHITRSSAQQDQGGSMISAIGELELWGFKPDTIPEDLDPITYTATFVAGTTIVSKVEFPAGATSIEEPEVPAKEGYTGAWAKYTMSDKDFIVRAVYTAIEVPTEQPTEAPTEAPTEQPTEAVTDAPAPDTEVPEAPATEAVTEAPAAESGTEAVTEAGENGGCASVLTVLPALLVSLCGLALLRRRH